MVRLFRRVAVLLTVFMVALQVMCVPVTGVPDVGSVTGIRVVSVAEAAPENNKDTSFSQSTTGGNVAKETNNKVNLGSSGVLKSIEDKFKEVSIQGVQRLRPHVLSLICILWLISFTTNWSLYEGQMRISMIIGSIMKVGFFLWLAINWHTLADDIFNSLQNIGLVASGGNWTGTEFTNDINGSTIVDRAFASVWEVFKSLSALHPLVSLLKIGGIALILVSHFMIAFEVFITRVEFRIFECLAFVFMPFGMFQATSFLFQKCVSGVFGYGAKLMVMTFLVGLCESQVNWNSKMGADGKLAVNPLGLTEKSTYGDCFVVGVSLLLLAFLVTKAGELAAGVTSGQPSMSGGAVRGALMNNVVKPAASLAAAGAIAVAANPATSKVVEGAAKTAEGAKDLSQAANPATESGKLSPVPAGKQEGANKPSTPTDNSTKTQSASSSNLQSSSGDSGQQGANADIGSAQGGDQQGDTTQTGGADAVQNAANAGNQQGNESGAKPDAKPGTPAPGTPAAPGDSTTGTPGSVGAPAADGTPGGTASGKPGGEKPGDSGKPGDAGQPAGDAKKAAGGDEAGGKAPEMGQAGWAAAKLADLKSKPGKLAEAGRKKAASLVEKAPGGKTAMEWASKASSAAGGVKDSISKSATEGAEGIGEKVSAAQEAIKRSPLESADRAAAGYKTMTDSNKSAMERLKGAGTMAGNVAAIAGHGMQKMTQSRAARIAKDTGKILARAALMRNPVTAVFYGEFNKMRNDYLQMQQFKVTENIDDKKQTHVGRAILHPDWERKNQN